MYLLYGAPTLAQSSGEDRSVEEGNKLDDLSLVELLNVRVVTASGGKAEDQDLSSANVLVYTRSDIQRHGWTSVADVLAHVPGLYVIDDLVTPSVAVRGSSGGFKSATRVIKIMINGIEVTFRPDMTAFLGPEFIPIDAVEEIEVARGPLSALYGSNAFIATVNVITRKAEGGVHGSAGVGVSGGGVRGNGRWATLSYGSRNVELLISTSDAGFDRSGLSIAKTFHRQDPESNTYRYFFGSNSQNDLSRPGAFYAHLGLSRDELGKLTLQGGYQRLDSYGEFQSFSTFTHDSRYSVENYWYAARAEREWADVLQTWAMVGYSQGAPTADDLQYLSGSYHYGYRRNQAYRAFDGRAGFSLDLLNWLSASADVDSTFEHHRVPYYTQVYRQAEGERLPGDERSLLLPGQPATQAVTNLALHGQLAAEGIQALPNLRIVGDARMDQSNLYPAQVSWRGAIGYRWFPGLTTRLVAGHAFQGPSVLLLYSNPGFGSTGNIIGNRTVPNQHPLLPQVVKSQEFIVNWTILDSLKISASFFLQTLERSIDFVANGLGYIAQNGPTRRFAGTELTTQLARGRFHSQLGVAYQQELKSEDRNNARELDIVPLYPAFWVMSSLGIDVPEAYLKLTGTSRWVGKRGSTVQNAKLNDGRPYTLNPYMRVDVALSSMGLDPLGVGETKLGVFVRNLTDERHSEPGPVGMDLPTLGRTYELHLAQQF